MCCSAMQCVAVRCSVLQRAAVQQINNSEDFVGNTPRMRLECWLSKKKCDSVLQCAAVCCSVLQCSAMLQVNIPEDLEGNTPRMMAVKKVAQHSLLRN